MLVIFVIAGKKSYTTPLKHIQRKTIIFPFKSFQENSFLHYPHIPIRFTYSHSHFIDFIYRYSCVLNNHYIFP